MRPLTVRLAPWPECPLRRVSYQVRNARAQARIYWAIQANVAFAQQDGDRAQAAIYSRQAERYAQCCMSSWARSIVGIDPIPGSHPPGLWCQPSRPAGPRQRPEDSAADLHRPKRLRRAAQ